MSRVRPFLLVPLLLSAFAFSDDAHGHGGVYRGPGDNVPPQGDPPPTPPTPPNDPSPKPPQTPGPRAPATPGGSGGPPTGGGAGAPRGETGVGKKSRGIRYLSWEAWWEANKDRYLQLRSHLGGSTAVTGNAGFLSGYGNKAAASGSVRPTPDDVRDRLIPAMIELLSERDADIVDSAALALGRMTTPEDAPLVRAALFNAMKSDYASGRQAAILAFGVLGDRPVVPFLEQVMADSSAGRRALGLSGSVQDLTRSLAAVALGQIGDPRALASLQQVIDGNSDSGFNLRATAVLALGRFTDYPQEVVPYLVERLRDERMEQQVRAQVPVALAHLGSAARPAIPDLVRLVRSRRTQSQIKESAVVALGQLATADDEEVMDALVALVQDGDEKEARHFGLIGLGQIAGRAALQDGKAPDEAVLKVLLRELTKPSSQTHTPFAALALGLAAREMDGAASIRTTIIVKLSEAFGDEHQPSSRAALALALGLARAEGGPAESLLASMREERETTTKGYLALSLGMLNHAPALADISEMIFDYRDPVMRIQAATALGLLGDREATPALLKALKEAQTLNVVSSLAKAIALIGDRSAIDPLLELARDKTSPGVARGFACVALGSIADRAMLPWNAAWKENSNYFAATAAYAEISSL